MKKMFRYTVHNMIGHPAMELLNLVGFPVLAAWIHDKTLPRLEE